mmetsp:Transcript_12462/g.24716  ORF Transcript_12462/g.24716 Transcript_12462/m.24716 type:complete len:307 (-) Transcript_12462:485-1405(-)|eukprot:CAMPEP_0173379360 /NCGR_PEP_ID=MMETSP1356-20130122/2341_1 /TAXON_ID=77927 ORGANISM="Hemiselmis virescens, Strain PCC157" /NCGR_SAMPLE_ID=MMETSP1356 /ASSEMBLY_ACC=CAM_ASM_000847 /LENGTH=306 /DNA_ID=CAMNT_0014332685 /DNA_START=179 /DNA_END=1099 /DNA_ORIENTATION=+
MSGGASGEVVESKALKARNETISGMAAGFACKLVEYPLDTVKVQVQTQTPGPNALSPMQMLSATIKKEGFTGLYRGIPSPLLGSMAENSVLFSSYGLASRMMHTGDAETMPFGKKLGAGAFSGFCVAAILTPVELIKCKMQTTNTAAVRYKSSMECLVATLKQGGIRALFHGHVGTLCREVPGNAAWFGGYELGVMLQTPEGGKKSDVHPLGLMLAGAMGGSMYWGIPFPFDVVKSKIQTDTHGLPPGVAVNVVSVFKHTWKTEGLKGLYRGCGITVARAAPSNAVLFCVYEMVMRTLQGDPLLGN